MSIKVLVVDDSSFMRQVLSKILAADPLIEVVGVAKDGAEALVEIDEKNPDVITMDIEMPTMDGLTCLEALMSKSPKPVIMVSVLTIEGAEPTIKALELGAIDFITKPSDKSAKEEIEAIGEELIRKIKEAAKVRPDQLKKVIPAASRIRSISNVNDMDMVAIGTSTGGPRALYYLLPQFPKDFPIGIVVAQHLPPGFTKIFAERLNALCKLQVKEAETGDRVEAGKILIAPSGFQTLIRRDAKGLCIEVSEEPVSLYKPSVDVLFDSMADSVADKALGIIMTGMGGDGAKGMKKMHDAGAQTIAESESSCVVFGMPKVAIEAGGVDHIESLTDIFDRLVVMMSTKR